MIKQWMKKIKLEPRPKVVIVFLIFLVLFFFFDFLTKYFLFDTDSVLKDGTINNNYNMFENMHDYKIFGTRSYPHYNTTLFSAFKISLPLWSRSIINAVLILAFIIPIFFVKKTFFGIALSVVVAGLLGNSIDVWFTKGNYVRDVFYTPWSDRGTFNIADLLIVSGSPLLLLGILISNWTTKK